MYVQHRVRSGRIFDERIRHRRVARGALGRVRLVDPECSLPGLRLASWCLMRPGGWVRLGGVVLRWARREAAVDRAHEAGHLELRGRRTSGGRDGRRVDRRVVLVRVGLHGRGIVLPPRRVEPLPGGALDGPTRVDGAKSARNVPGCRPLAGRGFVRLSQCLHGDRVGW